jgi:hypothetical protein
VRLSILVPFALAIAIPLTLPACSDGETTSTTGDGTCYDYAGFDGTTPAVTFKADVLPIFRTSCGLSASCHGNPSGPIAQPYLGPQTNAGEATTTDIDAIFAANVNVDSVKEPGMKIVAPNDPANSFLMHKMDNSLKCESLKCGGNCGGSMPLGSPVLAQDQRDTVRRWIAQGAKND